LPRLFLYEMRDSPADPQRHALAFRHRPSAVALRAMADRSGYAVTSRACPTKPAAAGEVGSRLTMTTWGFAVSFRVPVSAFPQSPLFSPCKKGALRAAVQAVPFSPFTSYFCGSLFLVHHSSFRPLSPSVPGRPMLFLCQMRDFFTPNGPCPPKPRRAGGEGGLRSWEGSYAHKGMHMAWMERVRNRAQKPVKTAPKTRKKLKKALNPRLPILPFGGLWEKNPPGRQRQGRWPAKNRPKIPPKISSQKLSTISG
jgi:hypothetical protein